MSVLTYLRIGLRGPLRVRALVLVRWPRRPEALILMAENIPSLMSRLPVYLTWPLMAPRRTL